MLPEMFDLWREVNGMPKIPGRTGWQPSLTARRIAMMLVAAMPMLTNIGVGLAYFLGGRGQWLVAVAYVASLALVATIGFTILHALTRPLDLTDPRDINWLDALSGDDDALQRRIAARWLHEAFGLMLLGLAPVLSAATCTAAIIRTTRVLQIATLAGLPRTYRRAAQIIRVLAAIILGAYGAIATFLPFFAMRSAINPPIILQP